MLSYPPQSVALPPRARPFRALSVSASTRVRLIATLHSMYALAHAERRASARLAGPAWGVAYAHERRVP